MFCAQIKIVVGAVAIVAALAVILVYCGFSLTEIVTMFSAIVVAVSAVATARYAYKGLSIWKEQHSGKRGYDLATRLLVSIRRYQDAMNDSVNLPEDEKIIELFDHRELQKHLDRNLLSEDPNVIESEALWDKEMEPIFNKIRQVEKSIKENDMELSNHLSKIQQLPDADGNCNIDKTQLDTKSIRKEREKLQEQINDLIKEAEDFLKQKIKLENPNPPPQPNTKKGTK